MSDWKFDLDDVGDDADDPDARDGNQDEEAADESDDLDLRDLRPPLEAGDPDPENAAFVLLGMLAMILVFVRLWLLVG